MLHVITHLFFVVLEQVRNFLPKMASANAALQRQLEENPEHSVDIEDIGDDEGAQHIEMVKFTFIFHICFLSVNKLLS